jgi:DNA repair exonuclease SbcCD ATPase subunit
MTLFLPRPSTLIYLGSLSHLYWQRGHLQKMLTAVSEHQDKVSLLSDQFKKKQKEINEVISTRQEMINYVAKAEEAYMKWKLVDDWYRELLSDFTSQEIEKDLLNARSRKELLQKIATLKAELPTVEAFNSLFKEFTDNSQRMQKINSELETITAQLLTKRDVLDKLEADFEYWRRQQGELASLFESLSQITQQYLGKSDLHACPTCGTDFVFKDKLLEAFEKSRESVRKREDIALPARFKAIGRDRAEVEKLQLSENQKRVSLREIQKNLSTSSERLELWLNKATYVWNLLQEFHTENLEKPSENTLSLFLEKVGAIDLEGELRSFIDKMTALEAQLTLKWAGLRKREYKDTKNIILGKLGKEELEDLKNLIMDSESWRAHIDKIHSSFQEAIRKRDGAHSELQKRGLELNEISKNMNELMPLIKENEEVINKTKVEIKRITGIILEMEQLKVNLTDPTEKIKLRMLGGVADELLAQISSLEASLLVSINAHKERAQDEERKKEILRSIETQARELMQIAQLQNNLKKITSLDTLIQQEWTKYSQNINAMFGICQ